MNTFKKISCVALSLYVSTVLAEKPNQAFIAGPDGVVQKVTYEKRDGYAVIEGDIIIGRVEEIQRQGALVHSLLSKRWPNGIIPYEINKNMPDKNRTYIKQAMDHIKEKTNVSFVLRTSSNEKKYTDYVEFIPSDKCSAYVGRNGGRQTISLATNCLKGNTIHEIMHTVGFFHEQARSDRDSYVKIVWDNIRDNAKGNFNIQLQNGFRMGGYDYNSIMHYGPKDFSKNGKDTIVPLQSGVEIGHKTALSSTDIEVTNRIYKKSTKVQD